MFVRTGLILALPENDKFMAEFYTLATSNFLQG
jgi:hypothetical protein